MNKIFTTLIFLISTVLSNQLYTVGPRGEIPVPSSLIALRPAEKAKVIEDSLTLALAFHDTSSEFSKDVIRSIREYANKLSIELVSLTSADFNAELQRDQYRDLLMLSPNILITLSLLPQSDELQNLSDSGTSIAFLSNLPENMEHPRDYSSVITDDLFRMGKEMAEIIAQSSGDSCSILYLYHDAPYYVTNQRDQSLNHVLTLMYPGITIVDSIGISGPGDVRKMIDPIIRTSSLNFDAIYTPWATIADTVLELLSEHQKEIDLYTIDRGFRVCEDLITGSSMKGIVIDDPEELGRALLVSALLHYLGEYTPPFSVVPVNSITKTSNQSRCSELILNRQVTQ